MNEENLEEKIKKLESQVKWYEEKFEELNNIHYKEKSSKKNLRYLNYQLNYKGPFDLFKKIINPFKVYRFIKYRIINKNYDK